MNALATLASDGPAASTITPGVLGFLTIAAIGGALYFLMKSMRNRLAAIQVEPDGGDEPAPATGLDPESTGSPAAPPASS